MDTPGKMTVATQLELARAELQELRLAIGGSTGSVFRDQLDRASVLDNTIERLIGELILENHTQRLEIKQLKATWGSK